MDQRKCQEQLKSSNKTMNRVAMKTTQHNKREKQGPEGNPQQQELCKNEAPTLGNQSTVSPTEIQQMK